MRKFYITLIVATILGFVGCENVEDGYRIDYADSNSQFSVKLISADRGVVGDSITYAISAESLVDINSIVVETSVSGSEKTGFSIPVGETDPLIDHVYGTIQPNTRKFNILYHYVVAQDTLDASIIFTLIDDDGKNTVTHDLYTIPATETYDSVVMYANSNKYADGFSTNENIVYHNLYNYEEVSAVNQAVQESLDIVFLNDGGNVVFAAPYSGYFRSGMSIKNKTLFKFVGISDTINFESLTPADVSIITENAGVKKGATQIGDLKVGDIIAYRTDFASTNPYHYGLIKINNLHPTNVDHYDGTSYVIEMDIITQK